MNPIQITGVVLALVAAGILSHSIQLRARIHSLREERELMTAPVGAPPIPVAEMQSSVTPAPRTAELTHAEKVELLRLRGQIQPLHLQLAALARLTNRNAMLQAELVDIRKLGGPPPPGYVRRSEARNAGTATADASFETLLWAVEHRDTNALFSVTDGPWRDSIVRQLAGSTVEELFKSMPLPGGRILARKELSPDTQELSVELAPGTVVPLKCRRERGAWVFGMD